MARDVETLQRRQQFGDLLRLSPQAIVILDADGRIREWNPAAVTLLGWTREELVGQSFEAVLGDRDRVAFLQVWRELKADRHASPLSSDRLHHDRTHLPVEIMLAAIKDSDGSFGGVVGTVSRTHPVASSEEALTAAADDESPGERAASAWELDEVTGLPGRRWLQRRLLASLPTGLQRAVAVVDVDAFALVNQVYGPESGDRVLAELAHRFTARCAPAVMGRWHADEFVFIVDAESADTELEALLETAASAAREQLDLAQDEIRLTVSAGWCTSATVPLSSLFTSASAAMAHAKAHGRDRTVLYDPSTMPTRPGAGLRLALDLERGLHQEQFRLHFQPIIDLATNDVVGVEALVRWERPGVGLLTPAAFLDVAERTGQILALGEWVISRSCQAAVTFAATRLAPLSVSVNVSARQLSDPGFLTVLRTALDTTGCDPGSIVIEVTETALLHDLGGAAATLEEIRALGLELDLDDFGTGYSSLLYLKHFPVDRIKIDRAFIAGLGSDVADTAIVASTIALAHSMGITATAEGVETVEQLGLLRQLGCDYAQGYLLSHPLPQPELMTWLEQQTPSRLLDRTGVTGSADRRQHVPRQTRRDDIADNRDEAGDDRDRAGDIRDQAADLRDSANDRRDRIWDRREAVANEREARQDERERANAAQDTRALHGPPPRVSTDPGPDDSASDRSRSEAGRGRARAAQDRARAAEERGEARLERDQAQADRSTHLTAREQVNEDRSAQHADTGREALESSSRFDALTGAYQWPSGLAAIYVETEQAQRDGDSITIMDVRLAAHDVAGQPVEQLAADTALVVVANAIGTALRPQDLLVRRDARAFVCLCRGLSPSQIQDRLAALHQELAAVKDLAASLTIGYAVLDDGKTIEDVLARALLPASPHPARPPSAPYGS